MLKLNHTYTHSLEIQSLLISIESHKQVLSLIPTPTSEQLSNLRRNSLMSSAVYSARIEGITDNNDQNKLAIQNLLDTYTWLSQLPKPIIIDVSFLQDLHSRSMRNLRFDAGHFRNEQSAIFNSAGIAIYLTPPQQDINALITSWLNELSSPKLPPPVLAAITHYQFEKIHPFLDGNGRVGRLVSSVILKNYGYDLNGLLSFEEYLNIHRDEYYATLNLEKLDITPFIIFFLTALKESGDGLLQRLANPLTQSTSSLLPRRQELVDIIRDHGPVSLDFLHRRFMAIPPSTLRYDLLSLAKTGYIKKLGTTRGALYQIK